MTFDADLIRDDLERVLGIITNGNNYGGLDKISIAKDMILNRLNIEDFVNNKPVVVKIINMKPPFDLVVIKIGVGESKTLLCTEKLEIYE